MNSFGLAATNFGFETGFQILPVKNITIIWICESIISKLCQEPRWTMEVPRMVFHYLLAGSMFVSRRVMSACQSGPFLKPLWGPSLPTAISWKQTLEWKNFSNWPTVMVWFFVALEDHNCNLETIEIRIFPVCWSLKLGRCSSSSTVHVCLPRIGIWRIGGCTAILICYMSSKFQQTSTWFILLAGKQVPFGLMSRQRLWWWCLLPYPKLQADCKINGPNQDGALRVLDQCSWLASLVCWVVAEVRYAGWMMLVGWCLFTVQH